MEIEEFFRRYLGYLKRFLSVNKKCVKRHTCFFYKQSKTKNQAGLCLRRDLDKAQLTLPRWLIVKRINEIMLMKNS